MRHLFIIFFLLIGSIQAQEVAVLKYNGGGDWYGNPTALPNLVKFCNSNIETKINTKIVEVIPSSPEIFNYPFIHMTGHGNVHFNNEEAQNLRNYLLSGGFLHIDDNYGINQYLRKESIKIFPDKELQEIPSNHPIFSIAYNFPDGLPKIHEHDGERPQALGLFENNRLILLFTVESDLGDGWENPEIHNDPESVRLKALKMGANIVQYAFEYKYV